MRLKLPKKLEANWVLCQKCEIGGWAKWHVFGRGEFPCDVLFLGEGPGKSEDVLGEAFVGPSGRLLDKALEGLEGRFFFTNLVLCRPCDKLGGPNRQPSDQEILNCAPRLSETLRLSNAKALVTLGRLPAKVWEKRESFKLHDPSFRGLTHPHPAWIKRRGGEASSEWPRYRDTLRTFIQGILHG